MDNKVTTTDGRKLLRELVTGCVGSGNAADYIRSMGRSWSSPRDIVDGTKTYKDIRKDLNDLRRVCVFLPKTIEPQHIYTEDGELIEKRMNNLVEFLNNLLDDKEDLAIAVMRKLAKSKIRKEVRRAVSGSKALFTALKRLQVKE